MRPEGGDRAPGGLEAQPPAGRPGRLRQALWAAGTRTPAPHRPALSSSVLAALLAVGVVLGLVVVHAATRHDAAKSSVSSTTVPPTTSTTGVQHLVPPTVASTTTTTAASQSTPPAPAPASRLCTPSDLSVSSSSDAPSYPSGAVVRVSTQVQDVVGCTFHPQGGGNYPCPSTVVVVQSGGGQVWPLPGQGEQCSPPASQVLEPGDVVTLSAAWPEQVETTGGTTEQAPPGDYQVLGTWSWAAGSGQVPYQVQAYSPVFHVG